MVIIKSSDKQRPFQKRTIFGGILALTIHVGDSKIKAITESRMCLCFYELIRQELKAIRLCY